MPVSQARCDTAESANEDPSGLSAEFAQGGCGGNQHFLLPVARGSATVAIPLSLGIQAEQREEGRAGREEEEEEVEELEEGHAG